MVKKKEAIDYYEKGCLNDQIDKCNEAYDKFLKDCKEKKDVCQKKAEDGRNEFCKRNSRLRFCSSTTDSSSSSSTQTSSSTTSPTTTTTPSSTLTLIPSTESFSFSITHYIIGAGIGGFMILGLVLLVKWIMDRKKPKKNKNVKKKKHEDYTIESPSHNFTRSKTCSILHYSHFPTDWIDNSCCMDFHYIRFVVREIYLRDLHHVLHDILPDIHRYIHDCLRDMHHVHRENEQVGSRISVDDDDGGDARVIRMRNSNGKKQ